MSARDAVHASLQGVHYLEATEALGDSSTLAARLSFITWSAMYHRIGKAHIRMAACWHLTEGELTLSGPRQAAPARRSQRANRPMNMAELSVNSAESDAAEDSEASLGGPGADEKASDDSGCADNPSAGNSDISMDGDEPPARCSSQRLLILLDWTQYCLCIIPRMC